MIDNKFKQHLYHAQLINAEVIYIKLLFRILCERVAVYHGSDLDTELLKATLPGLTMRAKVCACAFVIVH